MEKLTFDIYIISRLTHIYYARELRKIGLSFGEFPFLLGVFENDGISQEELSSLLMISKSSTAAMIRKLSEAGYVLRETDAGDRRNFRLHITGAGRKFIPEIEKMLDRCHGILTSGMTEKERSSVCGNLRKMRRNAEDAGLKSPASRKKRVKNLSE